MTSPEIKLTTDTTPPERPKVGKIWWWIFGAVIAVPAGVMLAGTITAPPRLTYLPTGRIVFLDADQPSERTTTLRGLYLVDTSGKSRELTHENEPQDTDGGQREWINQPMMAPDGHAVTYIKQLITLVDEKQSVDNQLWILPVQPENAKPYLLLDLSALKLKQVVGLAWAKDNHSIIFLQDGTKYTVSESETKPTVTKTPLPNLPELRLAKDISATRQPTMLNDGTLAYAADTATGLQIQIGAKTQTSLQNAITWALRPDGQIAYVMPGSPDKISIQGTGSESNPVNQIDAKWGWSIFGGRKITGLQWSSDGKYIGYTVSKPPVPEDELIVADVATGKSQILPFRTGRVAWDWVP